MTPDVVRALAALNQQVQDQQGHALFGRIPAGMLPLLQAGLEEMAHEELQAFTEAVSQAQARLRDQALKAAFATGRAHFCAPDNADELLNYSAHRIFVLKEPTR